MTRPRALIEDWLPIRVVSVESQRERGASSALPPLYFLHVWWARRPLIASRAAVLGSVMPAWSNDWPDDLHALFPKEEDYREWFIRLLGITGDPVAAYKRILVAKEEGIKLKQAYEGPRAFTIGPDTEQVETLRRLLTHRWGTETPTVLDPTAGGGSIPFESVRFGLPAKANELNPVASFILEATLTLPARFGPELAKEIEEWGGIWAGRVEKRLKRFFPRRPGESIHAYLFARTVACPETGKPVPLSPNWWLLKGDDPVAARIIAEPHMDECRFEIVKGRELKGYDPGVGTVSRGKGRSPWTGGIINGDYIKAEAQAGRMGYYLYAIAYKSTQGLAFRIPYEADTSALEEAILALEDSKLSWRADNIIPTENYPQVASDMRPHYYGMSEWPKFFSHRQLLLLGTAVEELRNLVAAEDMHEKNVTERISAVQTNLAVVLDKAADYNCTGAIWHPSRGVIAHAFARHDFSFKWSFVEFDGAHNLLPWAVSQVVSAYRGIAKLIDPSRAILFPAQPEQAADMIDVRRGDAADLPLEDGSVHAVVIDPPYYDNVQYAELSDFFYVWLKRTAGHLYPQFFETDLTDKASEAVANPARFVEFDKKNSKKLARRDYESKMTKIFAEAHRVLRVDGVLTVMFNHKKVEAWDALGRSLIEGGFEILTSWPVHTESEYSLHQAKKAASASTILLACRKRTAAPDPVWWDDLRSEVQQTARRKAEEYAADGIEGVDLYVSTFGPVLSVISRRWPVHTSEADPDTGEPVPLRPEEALDLARKEVAGLRLRGIALGRPVRFDPVTEWYLLAWDAFRAVEFPYDEARKLAFSLGLDLDGELRKVKIVAKKASAVVLQEPKDRRRPGLADPEEDDFDRLIDAVHAMMNAHREDGVKGTEAFLKRTGWGARPEFRDAVQALVNAVPRTKKKGRFIRPEAAALDALAFLFPDLRVPEEPRSDPVEKQGELELSSDEG